MSLSLKERRAKLVEALRSGKYQQGKAALEIIGEEQRTYCCLGVACRVAGQNGLLLSIKHHDNLVLFDDNMGTLPSSVRQWYGFSTEEGEFDPDDAMQPASLVEANDTHNFTFDMIADLIESEPPGMFEPAA
jgi:hypothetical protein